jgi:hypothetical protein
MRMLKNMGLVYKMFKQMIDCLTHVYVKCRAKCSCGNCCASECMAEEGNTLTKQSSTSSKKSEKSA